VQVIGLTIGHYRIIEELGRGGMGVVYRAQDTRLERHVALKFLPEQVREDPEAIERFRREARAASALNHPAICTIYDIGEEAGQPFIVMELLEGLTLKQLLDRQTLSASDALDYGLQIADGLDAAHARHIVHRDIKPANIFITRRRQAKLLDFGLAKLHEPGGSELEKDPTRTIAAITRVGALLGTVAYMSPEQVRGQALDARSDLFSLGVVLYEAMTGEHPFAAPTMGAIFEAILHRRPRAPREVCAAVPAGLETVVLKAMEKDRRRRFPNASAMRAAFEEWRKIIPAGPEPAPIAIASATTVLSVPRPSRRSQSGSSRSSRSKPISSLAILPFVNVGGDADTEYLSEGITESIIDNLSRLSGLRVVPRTTVFRYKQSDKDLQTIAKELKVKAILTGRVSLRGGQLVVQAELVDGARDAQLWGERYNRGFADVFVVQEEMATAISSSLQLRLSGDDRQLLARHPTSDSQAYEAYLKGRYYWNKRRLDAFLRAATHFQDAIDRDPTFLLAYTGLADTLNLLGYYNHRAPSTVYPRAKAAAARALELDPGLAEAHASLGYSTLFYDRDWPAAERHFQAAISLNPGYASGHQWYGWYLLAMGRYEDALVAMRRASEIDPLSLIINVHLGYVMSLAGQPHEAIAQLQHALELDPTFALAHLRLGLLYREVGRQAEGLREIERGVELSERHVGLGPLGQAYAEDGRQAEARDILHGLEEPADGCFASPLDCALICDGLEERERAFAHLEQALILRISDVVRLKALHWSEALRTDPRFHEICERAGLPA
jgi:serine/threonine protein kinase/tetratricopeptide (TPR) repeat protein